MAYQQGYQQGPPPQGYQSHQPVYPQVHGYAPPQPAYGAPAYGAPAPYQQPAYHPVSVSAGSPSAYPGGGGGYTHPVPSGGDHSAYQTVDTGYLAQRAGKWQKVLYFVNGTVFIFGLVIIILAGRIMGGYSAATMPAWALPLGIAFGAIICVFACFGFMGARRAPGLIATGSRNWFLIIYLLIVFLAVIIQLVVAATLLSLVGVIKNAQAGKTADSAVQKFESSFVSWTASHSAKWVDIQEYFNCCGYAFSNDTTATNPSCYPHGPIYLPCKYQLLDAAGSQAKSIGIFGIVFVLIQLAAGFCAFVLLFCVKPH